MEKSQKPHVSFEVEKVIGVSSDGSYQVQWAPTWVSKFHLVGCEHLIQEFLQQQSDDDVEYWSEANKLNKVPLEQGGINVEVDDKFQQPENSIAVKNENYGGEMDEQKPFSTSSSSDIWPSVADSETEHEVRGEGSCEEHLISATTTITNDDELSLVTMAGKGQQEMEPKDSFNPFDIGVTVKEEEEMMVVYPSDCTSDTMKQDNLSPMMSNSRKTATRILPTSCQNKTYVICPASSNKKTPAATSGAMKLPLEDIVRKISSASMHDIGSVQSPSSSQTSANSPPSDATLMPPPSLNNVGSHKPHMCGYCGKSFTLKHHLTGHIRSHTGEKPYKCEICEKAFSRSNILKEHLRTHYERPTYSCDICNRPFKQKHALKKHQLTHNEL